MPHWKGKQKANYSQLTFIVEDRGQRQTNLKRKKRSYYLFSVKRRLQSKRRMLATDRNTHLYFLQLFLGKLPSWVKHNWILLHLQRLLIKLAAFLKDERNHSSVISAQCFWKDPGQRFTTKRCVCFFLFFFFYPSGCNSRKIWSRLDRLIYWKTRLSKLFNHTIPSFNFQYYSIVAWSSLTEEGAIIIQLLMQWLMPGT